MAADKGMTPIEFGDEEKFDLHPNSMKSSQEPLEDVQMNLVNLNPMANHGRELGVTTHNPLAVNYAFFFLSF